jgi:hypothetical protein
MAVSNPFGHRRDRPARFSDGDLSPRHGSALRLLRGRRMSPVLQTVSRALPRSETRGMREPGRPHGRETCRCRVADSVLQITHRLMLPQLPGNRKAGCFSCARAPGNAPAGRESPGPRVQRR